MVGWRDGCMMNGGMEGWMHDERWDEGMNWWWNGGMDA